MFGAMTRSIKAKRHKRRATCIWVHHYHIKIARMHKLKKNYVQRMPATINCRIFFCL